MTSLELPPELKEGLAAVKERDGIPQSEQIRRAITAWLEERGVLGGTKSVGRRTKTTGRRT
jgi:predicted DNA-binding protein